MADTTAVFLRMVWSLAPLAATFALLILVLTTQPVGRLRQTLSRHPPVMVWTWGLLVVVLGAQILAGALEDRVTGSSPFLALPVVGQVAELTGGPRLPMLIIGLAVAAMAYSLAFQPSPRPWRLGAGAWILLIWITMTLVVTSLGNSGMSGIEELNFVAAASSLLAVLALTAQVDAELLSSAFLIVIIIALAMNYWVALADPVWTTTTHWTGGFLQGERFQGTFPQPNVAGEFFALASLLLLRIDGLSKTARLLMILATGYMVYVTGSRGALVIVAVGGAYMLILARKQLLIRVLLATGVILAVALPFSNAANGTVINGRDITWRQALSMIRDDPLVGGGAFPLSELSGPAAIYAHNQVLQTTVETGVVGCVLLFSAIVMGLHRLPSRDLVTWGAIALGLFFTFPFENPMRLYEPSFGLGPSLLAISVAALGRRPRGQYVHRSHGKQMRPEHDGVKHVQGMLQ
jgi:hypothetical protein